MEANNVKAMREALMHIQNLADALDLDEPNVIAILDTCRDALSEPTRNCDVGTVAEQCARHLAICLKHAGCATCPRNRQNISFKECILSWAQEPYTDKNAK